MIDHRLDTILDTQSVLDPGKERVEDVEFDGLT